MFLRSLAVATLAVCCGLGPAHGAPDATQEVSPPGPSGEAGVAGYRLYAKNQADSLVGMTRVLARAIRDNDLDTARLTYAPAHRYFARIAPIARAFHDLYRGMDARADAFVGKEADPGFAGFHRIEDGLFAKKSTAGLTEVADRLEGDARALQARLPFLYVTPALLLDGTIATLDDGAATALAGDAERYSQTDLWDVEATIDGARQVVTLLQPQLPTQTASQFAGIDALLEKYKDGCGFKAYVDVVRDDRLALRTSLVALSQALATRRGTLAMD